MYQVRACSRCLARGIHEKLSKNSHFAGNDLVQSLTKNPASVFVKLTNLFWERNFNCTFARGQLQIYCGSFCSQIKPYHLTVQFSLANRRVNILEKSEPTNTPTTRCWTNIASLAFLFGLHIVKAAKTSNEGLSVSAATTQTWTVFKMTCRCKRHNF